MGRNTLHTLAAAAIVAVVSTGAFAQAQPSARPAGAAERPAEDDLKKRAEALFDQLAERYRALASYSDTMRMEYDVEVKEGMDFFGNMQEQETRLALQSPNKLAVEAEHVAVISDGSKLRLTIPMFGQYIERDAASTWTDILLGSDMTMMAQQLLVHPALSFIVRGDERAADYQSELTEVHAIEPAQRDGRPGTLIRGTFDSPQHRMMVEEPIPFEYWIDDETSLLREASFDMTSFYNAFAAQRAEMFMDDEDEDNDAGMFGMEMPTYEKFKMILKVKDVTINADIPAERFVFSPDEDDLQKVENFDFMGGRGSSQLVLIGETAPDFTLPTLDGEELTLSDLRGKVVLLDFWALWCAPCVQALPHVQKVADRFEGQPVVVLGVNRDPAGSDDRISRMLERREITFGHVLDVDGEVAGNYHVTGIPCTILIDKDGIVQDVGMGFHPGKVDELSEKIEKLLAGEQLHTPEAIAEMRARADEDDDGPAVFIGNRRAHREIEEALDDAIGETAGRLEPLALHRGIRSQAWHLKLIDVDGDGSKKAVVPHQRGLLIIDLSDRSVEDVALSGLPTGSFVQKFDLVRIGGEPRWLVAAARHGMWGATGGVMLGLYDAEGKLLWSFEPDLPRDLTVQFGDPVLADLTGDGSPEIIITLQATRMERGRQARVPAQAAKLIVFSDAGQVLASHSAGSYVYGLHVVDAPSPDDHRQSVICISDGRALWLEYDDAAAEVSMRR